jgi:hypothetical protein
VPGSIITSSAQNYIPLYNQSLGVFNLTGKPTINVSTRKSTVWVNDNGQMIPYNQWVNDYTVDAGTFNSLFTPNPAVINSTPGGASIQNLTTRVVLLNPDTDYNFQGYGTLETIGNYTAYTGSIVTTVYTKEHGSQPINNLAAVRVAFNVVPNAAGPLHDNPPTIVKTFLANIVQR